MDEKSTLRILIEQWSGPAGMVVLLGAIVWGVQLNQLALQNSTQIAVIVANQKSDAQRQQAVSQTLAATAATVQHVADQVDKLELRMTRNEAWIYSNRRIEDEPNR